METENNKTWEEERLAMIDSSDGQIMKIRNTITNQLIEILPDGKVRVYQGDGSFKEFENMKKARKFHWGKFHSKRK